MIHIDRLLLMTLGLACLTVPLFTSAEGNAEGGGAARPKSVLDFKVKDGDGKEIDLAKYRGHVLLVVNTASRCGYTPQYQGLETLFRRFKDRGFTVLAFPANEFGAQEPGTDKEIQEFCKSKFDVTFPVNAKLVVKGDGIHPLYAYLTGAGTNPRFAGPIPWNFTKFLVNRKGEVVARFGPKDAPGSEPVLAEIEKALAEKP
jgi:glutathione peroxidase